MSPAYLFDLVILAADKDAAQALEGILNSMPSKLGLAAVNYRIIIAPRHDGEARARADELLRPFVRTARYALVVFDREGCGSNSHREELENQTLAKLTENGWGRACLRCCHSPGTRSLGLERLGEGGRNAWVVREAHSAA